MASVSARARHPPFARAVLADAKVTAGFRGERHEFHSRLDATLQILRLAAVSDAFAGQLAYRAKAALQRRRVPLFPRLLQRLAIASAGVYIGDEVLVRPGLYIVHGQVVIDGPVRIGPGVMLFPTVTVAAPGGGEPARIGPGVSIGTGARVLGPLTVGAGAQIGAGAVVVADVPEGATAVGIAPGSAPERP
jgi:serine O-acetyltransferase